MDWNMDFTSAHTSARTAAGMDGSCADMLQIVPSSAAAYLIFVNFCATGLKNNNNNICFIPLDRYPNVRHFAAKLTVSFACG